MTAYVRTGDYNDRYFDLAAFGADLAPDRRLVGRSYPGWKTPSDAKRYFLIGSGG